MSQVTNADWDLRTAPKKSLATERVEVNKSASEKDNCKE
jgi:hypothetical protein